MKHLNIALVEKLQ